MWGPGHIVPRPSDSSRRAKFAVYQWVAWKSRVSAAEDRREVQLPLADGRCDLEPPLSGFKRSAIYAQRFGADPPEFPGGAVGHPCRVPDRQGEDGRPGPAEFISSGVVACDKKDASSRPRLDRRGHV